MEKPTQVEIASTSRKSKETDPTIALTNIPAGTHSEYKPFSPRLHYDEDAQNQSFGSTVSLPQRLRTAATEDEIWVKLT
jgi:hypothetical protein